MNDASARLTPATFEQWMEALDRYPKCKEQLHNNDGFCCLGVLADIEGCGWNHHEPAINEVGEDGHEGFEWHGAHDGELESFLAWCPRGDTVMRTLARLNDACESFEPVKAKARELYAQWKAAQA